MADRKAALAVVGAGPAGLAAAAEAARLGIGPVVVLEREPEPGGVPRHCGHSPFGMREFGRVTTGRRYARLLADRAMSSGAEILLNHSVISLEKGGRMTIADPGGVSTLSADRVVLATGVRETPRSARLVSGDRPEGVLTTGALQNFVYTHGLVPFRRPVVVGTELVSFSALLTARHAGMKPVAMIEEGPRTTARWPASMLPRLLGVPLRYGARLATIHGGSRVEAVDVAFQDGRIERIDCDGVLFTGLFTPAAELVRMSHLDIDPGSQGPVVDQFGRTTDPAYFVAGNLLRPVETAGWSWSEGRSLGRIVARDLGGEIPTPSTTLRVRTGSGVKLALPQRIALPILPLHLPGFQLRLREPVHGTLTVSAGDRVLWRKRVSSLPERRIVVPLDRIAFGQVADEIVIEVRA